MTAAVVDVPVYFGPCSVYRLAVPGGWLYLVFDTRSNDAGWENQLASSTFVPNPKAVEEAVFAERKRCLDIVDNYYDGAPDAGSVPMSSVGSMIAQIRGEP